MKKIKLEIVGLSYSQTQSGAYALVLGEASGKRRLPIIIGGFEAQAIAIELEKISPSRPLTHDLFKSMAENFGISVKEIIIYNLVEGIFFAKLICTGGDKEVEIDTRTSDAIALAVRFKCPVYTYEFILSSAGIILEDGASPEPYEEKQEEVHQKQGDLSSLPESELKEMLKNAIDEENYEKASKIRDEMMTRKKSN
ncbi:MAG: bifunctional nuclease family protein [Bacteroidetes bacterium]|nr:bifunctional nuclease family protein [Bacteroidota bacterium]